MHIHIGPNALMLLGESEELGSKVTKRNTAVSAPSLPLT